MPRIGSLGLAEAVVLLLLYVLPLYLFWRVFGKAGMTPAVALVCLVPGVGYLLSLLILAFGRWPAVHTETHEHQL